MGLERVHRRETTEYFGPVRLGPQDLRDIAAVFADLDSKVRLWLPDSRTEFRVQEHRTEDLEDVLAFDEADTLPSIHVISAELRLSFYAGRDATLIDKPHATESDADQRAVEEAAERLRQIVHSRQVGRLRALRQGAGGQSAPRAAIAVLLLILVGGSMLNAWLTYAAAAAVTAGLVWLYFGLVLVLFHPKDLIRLRGRDLPWSERRPGLVGLLTAVGTVAVPLVVYGLGRVLG